MVFYKDVPVIIKHKIEHIKKIGGKIYRSIIKDYGDIPCGRYNDITGNFEAVVNNRGYAYAARKRMKYRKKIK